MEFTNAVSGDVLQKKLNILRALTGPMCQEKIRLYSFTNSPTLPGPLVFLDNQEMLGELRARSSSQGTEQTCPLDT